MNREDKSLLFKDLSARLPYGVKLQKFNEPDSAFELYSFNKESGEIMFYKYKGKTLTIGDVGKLYRRDILLYKPYLRPMSSMTKEEIEELKSKCIHTETEEDWEGVRCDVWSIQIFEKYDTRRCDNPIWPSIINMDAIDWLNSHHFDYRGLIEKGLAIEAPKGMYE